MANYLVGIIFTAMLIWPIIVNSQPGLKFVYLGIDWKADNLDNTLFWTSIILMIIAASAGAAEQNRKEKLQLKVAEFNNRKDGI